MQKCSYCSNWLANVDVGNSSAFSQWVSPKTLGFGCPRLPVGFWHTWLFISTASFLSKLVPRKMLQPLYCPGTGWAIPAAFFWCTKCNRKDGGVQHYPWLSEWFLCPFAGRHDHNAFQLTSTKLNSLSRSGASLRYHIKTFVLKFPKSLMPQEKLNFILFTVKCNLCLALSLRLNHLRDTGLSTCSPVLS